MQVDTQHISDDEKSEVAEWESFFQHPGWSLLLREFQPAFENIADEYRKCATEGALGYVRGRDDTLRAIVKLETSVEHRFNHLAQARAEPPEGEDD